MLGDDSTSSEDQRLIARYKNGNDLQVLGDLYKRYMPLVYGVCMKYLKDREESRDAVMQIFEKLVDALKKHEVSHFKSWLYTLARNYCLMKLRSQKGVHFEEINASHVESDPFMHPENELQSELNLRRLERCLEELGEEQKTCVRLFYIQQKCYRDISEATGFDGNKVKSYIQNGKRNLKICMERND
jgi:RNA polymerase sigma factor (sigma-70 family)